MQELRNLFKKPRWFVILGTVIGIVTIGHLLLQTFQNDFDFSVAVAFAFQWHVELFLLSSFILFIVFIWLYSLIGHIVLTSMIYLITTLVIGIITLQKMSMRGEPLYPSDIEMINEVSFLLKMAGPLTTVMLGIVLMSIFIGAILWKKKTSGLQQITFYKKHKKRRVLLFILSTLLLYYVGQFNNQTNKVRAVYDQYAYWIPYSQDMNYYNNGFVAGFLYNLSGESIGNPDQYSKKTIAEIASTYQKVAEEVNQDRMETLDDTNIIFIMNESFSDPYEISKMTKYNDPIPYYRKIAGETVSGFTLAPAYGGGTANSEFEALTGFSLEPLAPTISTPYTQLVSELDNMPSLAKSFKEKGLYATAIHPFNTTMYKRREAYEKLGFDEFIYDDTMTHTATLSKDGYISDRSAYKEIFHVMEQTVEKDFIHLVTMQNHTPYANKYDEEELVFESRSNRKQIEGYFQDLHHSDLALKQLIEAAESYPEEMVIVFWGDHLPSIYGEEVKSAMIQEEQYKTPYFIFSSEKIEKITNENKWISPQFLYIELLDMKKQKITPYQAFLKTLSKEVPAFEKGMYYDKTTSRFVEDESLLSGRGQLLLKQLHAIQYDVIKGENFLHRLHFFE
ncbi:LTA synthase family protein [Lacticigenium naphthae]|uniref:LTA synthase family protein n=1 Tax=Lacticigenium naphthae TaxID=515351 RepID=UPI0003FE7CCE|nr:LTA synthase family protein [Lacticigenium naphthae]